MIVLYFCFKKKYLIKNYKQKLFLEKEYLGAGDEWYCPKCKSFQKVIN